MRSRWRYGAAEVKALALLALLLSGCTLVHVGVNSGAWGESTVQPNGINVTVHKGAEDGT